MSRRITDVVRTIDEVVSTTTEAVRTKEAALAAVQEATPRHKTAQALRDLAHATRTSDVDVSYDDLASSLEAVR